MINNNKNIRIDSKKNLKIVSGLQYEIFLFDLFVKQYESKLTRVPPHFYVILIAKP